MIRIKIKLNKILLLLMFSAITLLIFITQVNAQIFTIVFKKDFSSTTKDGIVINVEGDLIIKNEKDEIIAEGKAEVKEGFIALRSKKGVSFEYKPLTEKINNRKWSNKEPTEIANIRIRKNKWTIENDNFFLLIDIPPSIPGFSTSYPKILLHESIVRASILTLSKGDYKLFGYQFKAKKDGAKVIFLNGIIVENHDCEIYKP